MRYIYIHTHTLLWVHKKNIKIEKKNCLIEVYNDEYMMKIYDILDM